MAHFGRYGRGLDAFVEEWGLQNIGDETLDPAVLEALQALLDAVAPERGYALSFVPSGTAATSFSTKRVVITSEAVRGIGLNDRHNLYQTQRSANMWSRGARFRVSAAMVCHEVSHIRYGQDTAGAVDRAYKGKANLSLARTISNVLDDRRIEEAFSWDFPGFGRDLFHEMLAWVARKSRTYANQPKFVDEVIDRQTALNAILIASRYDQHYCWRGDPATTLCREYGKKWARKYTKDDTIALHLAGVKACIDFLRQFPKPEQSEPVDETNPFGPPPESDDEGEDEGEGGSDESEDDEDGDDESEQKPGTSSTNYETEDEPEGEPNGGTNSDDESDEDEDEESYGSDDQDEDDEDRDGGADDDDEEDDETDGDEPEDDDNPVADDDEDGTSVLPEPKADLPDVDSSIASQGTSEDKATNREKEKTLQNRDTVTSEETGGYTVRINRAPRSRKGSYTHQIMNPDAGVAHEVRLAFESTRYSHDEWAGGHQTGRFRSRDAARAASGDLNVFSRRESESSTRVHLAIVIDYSGSMSGRTYGDNFYSTVHAQAAQLAATIADAMETSPVFRQSVWTYRDGVTVTLDRVWSTGSTESCVDALRLAGDPGGGTPTGDSIYALGREMVDDRKADEALLIVSITDGVPNNSGQVKYAVEHWGERGVAIVGIRVGTDATDDTSTLNYMRGQYGEGNVIGFTGDWKALAQDIGEVVGRVLAGTMLPK